MGCPGAVCILMLILLPQEGLLQMRSRTHTQVISQISILTGQIKTQANDWALEVKGGTGGLREEVTGRERGEEEEAAIDQNCMARRNSK